jgi:hypothetical protein
MANFTY